MGLLYHSAGKCGIIRKRGVTYGIQAGRNPETVYENAKAGTTAAAGLNGMLGGGAGRGLRARAVAAAWRLGARPFCGGSRLLFCGEPFRTLPSVWDGVSVRSPPDFPVSAGWARGVPKLPRESRNRGAGRVLRPAAGIACALFHIKRCGLFDTAAWENMGCAKRGVSYGVKAGRSPGTLCKNA